MSCLYQLIFPNGKSYIGITSKTAERRFKVHCQNSKTGITEYPNLTPEEKAIADKQFGFDNFGRLPWLTYLGKAIKEHGKENVIVRTLVIANDLEYLQELEIKAIKRYRTLYDSLAHYSGYNTSKGNCPKEIDYVVNTKKWRLSTKPSFKWPPNYFANRPIYVADFETLKAAKQILAKIRRNELLHWMEYVKNTKS